MIQGPNVKKLIVHKMSLDMVPSGGGLPDALAAFGKIGDHARVATDWVSQAIAAVKAAPGNPYGDDDEAIAGEILRRIEARKATC